MPASADSLVCDQLGVLPNGDAKWILRESQGSVRVQAAIGDDGKAGVTLFQKRRFNR